MIGFLLALIALIFVAVIGWHLFFPILGGVIAITATVWVALLTVVIAFAVGTLFLFIATGIGIFILGGFGVIAAILAIIFFPVLFPILLPLLVVFLFISFFRRKHQIRVVK